MKCPICRKEVKFDDPFMPFCSDRCRIIDLGNWASEKYTISTPCGSRKKPKRTNRFDEVRCAAVGRAGIGRP